MDNTKLDEMLIIAKPIFLKWERLRIIYNGILFVTLALVLFKANGAFLQIAKNPIYFLVYLMYGVGANICYFAGPTAETYMEWLGINKNYVTIVMFTIGVSISIPLVFLSAVNPLFF